VTIGTRLFARSYAKIRRAYRNVAKISNHRSIPTFIPLILASLFSVLVFILNSINYQRMDSFIGKLSSLRLKAFKKLLSALLLKTLH